MVTPVEKGGGKLGNEEQQKHDEHGSYAPIAFGRVAVEMPPEKGEC